MKLDDVKTANDLGLYLFALRDALNETPAETLDDSYAAVKLLSDVADKIYGKPELVSGFALDALFEIALTSSISNVGSDQPYTPQNPAQDVALRAARLIGEVALHNADSSGTALARLDRLATESLDVAVRDVAISQILMSAHKKNSAAPVDTAVQLLEQQAKTNTDVYARCNARENLLTIARENNAVLPAALRALTAGVEDNHHWGRSRSLGLLANTVESLPLTPGQIENLSLVFETSAKKSQQRQTEEHSVQEGAEFGLQKARERLSGSKPNL